MSSDQEISADIIVLHELIIHKVDHKNYEAPVLADLPSTVSDEVSSFIRKHIDRNRGHKYTSTARYRDGVDNTDSVKGLGDDILNNDSQFVKNTRRIAELLFAAQKKGNTSPGELVFCMFSDTLQENERWLAIMKMDPEDGFVGREEKIGDQIRIVLERVKDVLPTGELQKCAFVMPISSRIKADCDLLVLDQQRQNSGGTRQVASYFLREFLGAERDLNSRDLTYGFLRHVNQWSEDKYYEENWNYEQVEQFKQSAIDAIRGQRLFDIPAFANQVLDNEEEENQFLQTLTLELSKSGRVTNLVFQPNQEVEQRLTKVRRFKGDHGLEVKFKVSPNVPDDFIKVEEDPSTNTQVITIRTAKWEQV